MRVPDLWNFLLPCLDGNSEKLYAFSLLSLSLSPVSFTVGQEDGRTLLGLGYLPYTHTPREAPYH